MGVSVTAALVCTVEYPSSAHAYLPSRPVAGVSGKANGRRGNTNRSRRNSIVIVIFMTMMMMMMVMQ